MVVGPNRRFQPERNPAQNLVAGLMALAVVDGFEVVYVQPQKPEALLLPFRALDFLIHHFVQAPPVLQAGQGIDPGKALQFFGAVGHLLFQLAGGILQGVGHFFEMIHQAADLVVRFGQVGKIKATVP